MSQTAKTHDETNDTESIADVLVAELSAIDEILGSVERSDLEEMSDEELVEVRTLLKELEGSVETARKDKADDVLEDRVEPGERLHGLKRIQSHNKYLKEDDGSVVARAVAKGIDYTEFVSVNASTLAKEHPDLAEIGQSEYTYFV